MHRALFAALLIAFSSIACAHDIDNLGGLTQPQFQGLSADMSAVLQFKQLQPAAPEGITGFKFGVDASATHVQHEAAWKVAASGSATTTVSMVRLRFAKGLPNHFGFSGYYGSVPGSNVQAYGFALRYALIPGGVTTPALGLRASYSKLISMNNLNYDVRSAGLSLSKGFGPFTPYIGASHLWISSLPATSTGLNKVDLIENEAFVGFSLDLNVMNIAVEADRIDDNVTYSAKLAVSF